MNIFSTKETVTNYMPVGVAKTKNVTSRLIVLGILAGVAIAIAGVASATASCMVSNGSMAKLVAGCVFPCGLCIVVLMGAELFTGNNLIIISVLGREAKLSGMLRNWIIVYLSNFVGSMLIAAAVAYFGQQDLFGGELALSSIRTAVAKCSLPFDNAIVLGILCNALVCAAVFMAMSAKCVPGKILACFVPIALFVISGYEHSVANMYYGSVGIFLAGRDTYAAAIAAGIDITNLTWGNFLLNNMLPVTIGNIIGGCSVGWLVWFCNGKPKKDAN